MHSYTVWSPEPDAGATTLAANLARAHAEAGERVLAIDFAPPGGGLTAHYGREPGDDDADNVVDRLLEDEPGSIEDLVVSAEPGVDLVPTHPHLDGLGETLEQNATLAEMSAPRVDYEYPKSEQLRRVLFDSKVFYEYDLIVLDVAPGFGQHAFNAAYASPHLLVPTAPGVDLGQVEEAIERLESEIDGANLTALGAVANRADSTDADAEESPVPRLPVAIPDVPELFGDARENGVSVFELADGESRELDPDEETVLEAFSELADLVYERLANPSRAHR